MESELEQTEMRGAEMEAKWASFKLGKSYQDRLPLNSTSASAFLCYLISIVSILGIYHSPISTNMGWLFFPPDFA